MNTTPEEFVCFWHESEICSKLIMDEIIEVFVNLVFVFLTYIRIYIPNISIIYSFCYISFNIKHMYTFLIYKTI